MTALHDLQRGWRQTMLQGSPAALSASALCGDVRDDGIAPERRLGIHRNHLYVTLREALGGTFPTVKALVGADFFDALATRFITAHPPQGPCLFEYGDDFAAFIDDSGMAGELPYLADIARLDWAFNACFHADDPPPFDPGSLGAVAAEDYGRLVLATVPAMALLRSDWPLAAIWQVTQPDSPDDARVDLDAGADRLVVHRDDWNVVWRRLSVAEHDFLQALQAGRTLGEAAAASEGDPAFDLGSFLGWAVGAGLFCGFHLAENAAEA